MALPSHKHITLRLDPFLTSSRTLAHTQVPQYEKALAEGHLSSPPLATAVPALARLAVEREEPRALHDLRAAGAERWRDRPEPG